MSRIGNKPIEIPEKVELKIEGNLISVKGPKGELTVEIVDDRINYEINENILNFSRSSEVAEVRSLHGLYRSLIANNIQGVLEGYKKTLLLQGVGHRATLKGNDIEILCGFSHPVIFKKVEGINFEVPDQNTIMKCLTISQETVSRLKGLIDHINNSKEEAIRNNSEEEAIGAIVDEIIPCTSSVSSFDDGLFITEDQHANSKLKDAVRRNMNRPLNPNPVDNPVMGLFGEENRESFYTRKTETFSHVSAPKVRTS